ncbi:MAG: UDP-N-acetylmuramoyl-L-alanyl-D-glutamate--2,6-diaminopimelate ligase [Tepidisphaeraceae bacterium]
MLLHSLLRGFDSSIKLDGVPDLPIGGVCEDSRQARPGDLFIARAGTKTDGKQYALDAAAKGAVAAVADQPIDGLNLPQIVVADPAAAISPLAEIFHGSPSRALRMLAVTGTNGKTTTAYLVRHILKAAGRKCGMIGTVEIDDGRECRQASMTTPGAADLSRLLAAMRDNGAEACSIEVSSHALHQNRVAGLHFAAAAFTNLTGDHRDYHKTIANYAAAKAMLFDMLDASAVACVNTGDPKSHRMIRNCRARIAWWGFAPRADYRAEEIFIDATGSHFVLVTPKGRARVDMGLIGQHNIANALTAASLVGEAYGIEPETIARALADAAGAPGRLQPVRMGQGFGVFVDYAHTDDGLKNVLTALRPLTPGQLRVVFGCGGDRDNTKRPRMAKVAERLADVIYVTSDNPRTEDPASIIQQIMAGFRKRRKKPIIVEADRHQAIHRAINEAEPGDVVLLAGKGHENYQILGMEKHHFDDVEEAKQALGNAAGKGRLG